MKNKKFRISDFILEVFKKLFYFLIFNVGGFAVYALTVSHIVNDKHAEMPEINSALRFFSVVLVAIFLVVICTLAGKDIGKKTKLVESSRLETFDKNQYYKDQVIREVLPLFVAGNIVLIPYAVFYSFFGFGYQYSLMFENMFVANILFFMSFGPLFGVVIENLLISVIYAIYLYRWQKKVLADRMWIRGASRQEYDDSDDEDD